MSSPLPVVFCTRPTTYPRSPLLTTCFSVSSAWLIVASFFFIFSGRVDSSAPNCFVYWTATSFPRITLRRRARHQLRLPGFFFPLDSVLGSTHCLIIMFSCPCLTYTYNTPIYLVTLHVTSYLRLNWNCRLVRGYIPLAAVRIMVISGLAGYCHSLLIACLAIVGPVLGVVSRRHPLIVLHVIRTRVFLAFKDQRPMCVFCYIVHACINPQCLSPCVITTD